MKIEIRETKENGIIQVTTLDERWYLDNGVFRPSSSWISSHYPKGIAFYKWLAEKGWDEAEAIKVAAGNKGSKVHKAIENLLSGQDIRMDDKYANNNNGLMEELTVEEWEAIMSFVDWYKKEKPKEIIYNEKIVISSEYNYAGTLDIFYKKQDDTTGILDIKTSSAVWPEYELQLSSYKQALQETGHKVDFMEILQVGYKYNKSKYKVTELEDKFKLFLAAREIWQNECGAIQPKQKDYPMLLTLKPVEVATAIVAQTVEQQIKKPIKKQQTNGIQL